MTEGATLQTVSRAIAVLRCFNGGDKTLSLAELTHMMGLNKVTVFRLASTLAAEGMLAYDREAARYRVSLGLMALGRKLLNNNGIRDCAHPTMERARTESGETICLSVREKWDQVIIHALPSPQPVRYVLEVASRGPIHNGAAGQCLLVALANTELEALAADTGLAPSTEGSVGSFDALNAKLAEIRARGYGISLGERISEAAAVAAPITTDDGSVVASLSIVMPKTRAKGAHLEACTRIARETAVTISREIGSQGI